MSTTPPGALPKLAGLSTQAFASAIAGDRPVAVIVPCGSVEPHGPHLPLGTDTTISERAIDYAAPHLAPHVLAFVAPAVAYGVTDYARGFAGAISIFPPVLSSFLRAIVDSLLADGVAHVCLVNNHLEPAQDAAIRAAIVGFASERVSVACPLDRQWARRLSDEFKRGECHAGRYESSLVLEAAPDSVDEAARAALPAVPISLSQQIKAGVHTFAKMGLASAYAGAPAEASAEEGRTQYAILGEMIAAQILSAMNRQGASDV